MFVVNQNTNQDIETTTQSIVERERKESGEEPDWIAKEELKQLRKHATNFGFFFSGFEYLSHDAYCTDDEKSYRASDWLKAFPVVHHEFVLTKNHSFETKRTCFLRAGN